MRKIEKQTDPDKVDLSCGESLRAGSFSDAGNFSCKITCRKTEVLSNEELEKKLEEILK